MKDKQDMALLKQYQVLSDVQKRLDNCVKSIKNNDQAMLKGQLNGLNQLIENSSNLFYAPRTIGIFSASLPREFKYMAREVDDAVKLLENQKLLNINHRTS
jgi:hypothetical protein